jgi:solute carrier family 50 protein (sugar transporter)
VINTKNAVSIPKLLSITSLACSFSWFVYGYLLNDAFIMGPNIVGMILSSAQLALIAMYGQHQPVVTGASLLV